MSDDRTIQVPLPRGAEPTSADLELLQAAFQAIVDLRFPRDRAWEAIERALTAGGWSVRARLMWVAEARKGRESEQATGHTRDEAFAQLSQLTKLDEVAGVP